MPKINNSQLITQVLKALFTVVGRRTLDSFAIQILKTTITKLGTKYDFMRFINVSDNFFIEDEVKIGIDTSFETVEPLRLGDAIDALIRVVYMELIDAVGDDVGLFFVTELKEHLGDHIIEELRDRKVHLEKIQSEQHLRYQTKAIPTSASFLQPKESIQPDYTWDTVSTWKYDNNVCRLYDSNGKLLDTLYLDLLIEEYVERVAEVRQKEIGASPQTTMLKVTDKETELLETMRRRDIDVESAVTLLHVSRQKFDTMIKKLLQLEMLQFISDNEVKLTEKGLQYLSDKER